MAFNTLEVGVLMTCAGLIGVCVCVILSLTRAYCTDKPKPHNCAGELKFSTKVHIFNSGVVKIYRYSRCDVCGYFEMKEIDDAEK